MKTNSFSYKIDNIELSEFTFRTREIIKPESKLDLHYNITVNNRISPNNNLIIQNIGINIISVKSNEDIAGISVFIGYKIDTFEKVVKLNDDTKLYDVNPELEALLINISVATCRGILYSKLQGTYLSNAILPILSNKTVNESLID